MSYLHKIISTKLPLYLDELIPYLQRWHRYPGCFHTFRFMATFFQNSFLPFTLNEWNKLDSDIKNIDSHALFRRKFLTFIRPLGNHTYGIYDQLRVRLLNRLRLGFSHLREHKFKHNFADALYPLCSCSLKIQNITFCATKITYHFAEPLWMI